MGRINKRMVATISARIRVVLMAMLIAGALKLINFSDDAQTAAPVPSGGGARIALEQPA